MSQVLEFSRKPKAGRDVSWFWNLCFECDAEGIKSVQVNGVDDTLEDRRRVVECLEDFCARIKEELEGGA